MIIAHKNSKPKVKKTCEICGHSFLVHPYRANTAHFCSRKCKGVLTSRRTGENHPNWKSRIEKICINCGKTYYIIPSWEKESKFCSKSCHSSYKMRGPKSNFWKGGITPVHTQARHSSEYKQWRKAVFERDHYTCRDCGKQSGDFHAHHIRSFSKYPPLRYDVNNGVTLCKPCHRKKHSHNF